MITRVFTVSLERPGQAWRERLDAVPEYQVVPDGEMFRTSFLDSFLFTSEYRKSQALKTRLLEEHHGSTPEDLFRGDEVETPCGPAFRIPSTHPLETRLPAPSEVKTHLLADLTLVEGIGPATERLLRARGYATIRDLLPHRRFGAAAQRCLEVLDSEDPREVMEWVARWYLRSTWEGLRSIPVSSAIRVLASAKVAGGCRVKASRTVASWGASALRVHRNRQAVSAAQPPS